MEWNQKLSLAVDYWLMGGEIVINGKTYVWLDNKVVDETENELYVIDGLAVKGRSYSGSTDEVGEDCYIGCKDMPLHAFIRLVSSIDERTLEEMALSTVLTEYNRRHIR